MPSPRLFVLGALTACAVVAAAILLPHSPAGLRDLLMAIGPAAPLIALAAWVLLTPALVPGTVLAATGGLAFGALGGAALAFAGALAGGLAAFALARTGARGAAERLVAGSPKLAKVDALIGRRGFAAILAARLMPGVPATGLHYAAGLSQVRPRAFAAAMAIGALLRTTPYAVLGTGLASGSLLTLLVAGSSIVLGGVAAAVLFRQIRRQPASAAA
jgi:uncharacterized membrane protein YdjX (TVP38/TMEM64 family)